jgi:hypothetical protein
MESFQIECSSIFLTSPLLITETTSKQQGRWEKKEMQTPSLTKLGDLKVSETEPQHMEWLQEVLDVPGVLEEVWRDLCSYGDLRQNQQIHCPKVRSIS